LPWFAGIRGVGQGACVRAEGRGNSIRTAGGGKGTKTRVIREPPNAHRSKGGRDLRLKLGIKTKGRGKGRVTPNRRVSGTGVPGSANTGTRKWKREEGGRRQAVSNRGVRRRNLRRRPAVIRLACKETQERKSGRNIWEVPNKRGRKGGIRVKQCSLGNSFC